jgi:DNA-binding GntR family transcriptional regulator
MLRADVLSGKFAPEEVLLETVLARVYGLSRTPVREALGRLEQDGLLERGTRGYRVRSGTPQDVLDDAGRTCQGARRDYIARSWLRAPGRY